MNESKIKAIYSTNNLDVKYNQCCPYCGASHYMENFATTTAAYYPPIYENGVNINPDRNKSTIHCTCIKCGRDFTYKY